MGLKVTVQVDTSVPGGGRLRIVNQAVTGPPGPQGDPGPTGPQGPAGTAATIAVGTVTTVDFGDPATVTNSGTSSAAVFDFEIPEGEPGQGVPAHGTTGQILAKINNQSYNTEWVDPTPKDAQYVTLATNGTLTAERVLTAGTGITLNDGGAGAAVTVATTAILPTIVDAKGDLIVGTAADTVARLPVGATTGHVLTVDPLEAAGMKWAAASGGAVSRGIVASTNTNAGHLPGVGITTYSANLTLITNGTIVSPIVLDEAFSVSGFAAWVDFAGSGTLNFAVYNASRTWAGTTKAIAPTTGVSNSTTGSKIENITPVTLQPGRYLLAMGCTTGGAPRVAIYLGSFWGTVAFPSGNNSSPRSGFVSGVAFPDNIGTTGWPIPSDYAGMSGQIYPALLRGSFV